MSVYSHPARPSHRRSGERRRYPRARSGFRVLHPAGVDLLDISPYGARVRVVAPEALLGRRLWLQAEGRPVEGEIASRPTERARSPLGWEMRLRFDSVDADLHEEILRAGKAQLFCDGVRKAHQAGLRGDGAGGHRVLRSSSAQSSALHELACSNAVITLARLRGGRPWRAAIAGYDPRTDALRLALPPASRVAPSSGPAWWCAAAGHESYLGRASACRLEMSSAASPTRSR